MAFGVIGFEMMIPTDWWGKMKTSTSMQDVMKTSGRFHQFTKYQYLLFGLIAFGEIPDREDQADEISKYLEDSELILDGAKLKAQNIRSVYCVTTHNVLHEMQMEPYWARD
jgi:hypothetical protein